MLGAFANSLKIPELRKKIIFTFLVLAVCRLAATIPVPNIDPEALASLFESLTKNSTSSGVVGILNIFSGGALQKFAIAALGIMPYISASIIMQLMTPVMPFLERLSREGEDGRQKITQYTRYLAVFICLIQGTMLAKSMENPGKLGLPNIQIVINPGLTFEITTVIILLAGTLILMWLGEQITARGIGNGISMIIAANIINRMPAAIAAMIKLVYSTTPGAGQSFTIIHVLLLIAFFLIVCALAICLTLGIRKIPVKYASRMVGHKTSKGQTTYMPLRVNHSGVMPIIFGSAILMFPTMLFRYVEFLNPYAYLWNYGSASYIAFFALAIILFAFFWVANQFNPIQIADDLKKHGAYVPGVRPGKPTAQFLDHTMTRITVVGSLSLVLLATIPMLLAKKFGIPGMIAQFFGGTSLLIIVGVTLDTVRQIESQLLARRYDGFFKKGKIKSRQRRGY
ncbi:MAG: preprotein translocase subunit SecY [Verrucomicrobiota bacterium]|nr:preprotein translocase subunit SecY [Verrucomicrobiota bacterium]